MKWDAIEGNWKQLKGKVTEQWGRITDDHVEEIAGKRDQLSGKIQQFYGISKDAADAQIDDHVPINQGTSNANQDWKSPRPPMRITGVAFAVACAASMAVTIAWVPTSNGSPKVLVARSALQVNAVQFGPDTALPGLRWTRAECADCGGTEPKRVTGRLADAGSADHRYAARVDSVAVTTGANQYARNADLATFLDWHMNARNANGSVRHEFGCALSCRDSGSRF